MEVVSNELWQGCEAMRFSNLKIATKIYAIFFMSFFLVACLAANQIWSSAQVEAASAALARDGTILAGIRNRSEEHTSELQSL